MLNSPLPDARSNDVIVRSLTDDPAANTVALGCPTCPHYEECGGLAVKDPIVDCVDDLCCGDPSRCTRVCRHNPILFVQQIREVQGFKLDNVPRADARPAQIDADVVPLIYHGSSRSTALGGKVFALRLPDLIDFKRGQLHHASRDALCAAYRIDPSAALVLTGVNHDHRIEPWWTLGETRIEIIKALKGFGIELISTPNFSLLLDNPRTDDLYAMKRIAITFEEFMREGVACALHPNGRTHRDFERWSKFIAERPEIQMLAYEFITGPAYQFRMQFHIERLTDLAAAAGRPLDIILRGDPRVIPALRRHFRHVIYVDTTAFMKTIMRCSAERADNSFLRWPPAPTLVGEALDKLLGFNIDEQTAFLRAAYYGCDFPLLKAA